MLIQVWEVTPSRTPYTNNIHYIWLTFFNEAGKTLSLSPAMQLLLQYCYNNKYHRKN